MIIVTGYLRVGSDDPARFRKQIAAHCETVRTLPGCLHYVIAADMVEPALWWVTERWEDATSQAAHLVGDHMAEFNMMMNHAKLAKGQIEAFETDDPGKWLIRS